LLEVCSEFSLCVTNTMFQLQNKFKTSWMHPRSKHWHLIDFVIVRRSDLRDVKITRSLRGADCWTDHRRIRSQLSMHVRPASRMKQPCKRLNTNALLTEEVRGNFQRTLNLQWEELSNPSEGPADATTLAAEWESITDMILSATMKSTLGVMRKRHQDWFDANRKEIHVILYEKNSAYKAHLQQPKSAAHYQRWIRIRSQVQHHLREMRNSWWMTKAQEIQEHANNSNIRAFYEALKSVFGPIRRSFCHVKDSSGTLLIKERDGILSQWAEHFNTLLNKRNPSDTSFLDSLPSLPPITCLDNTPTLTEVRSAISGLKSNKLAEVFKYGGKDLHVHLHAFICKIWSACRVPQQWKDATSIAAIYKNKGDRADCGNSRGISLLSVGGKILARVMLNRLLTHVAEVILPESQCGFCRGRSTIDMVFVAHLHQ